MTTQRVQMTRPLILGVVIALTTLSASLWANVTENDLSRAMFGKVYAVTQKYLNYSKDNPTPGNIHAGIDYGAPQGTPVRAILGGKIVAVDPTIGCVGIDDGIGVTFYLHMRNLKFKSTDVGKSIQFATQIGEVSNVSPQKINVHLHVEVRKKSLTYPHPTQPVGELSVGSTASLTYNPLTYFGY